MSIIKIYNKDSTLGLIEILDSSIDLILTSPPYWDLVDYGIKSQIGFGETYDNYLKHLYKTFDSFLRVIKKNRMIVINVSDVEYKREFKNNECVSVVHSLQSDIIHYFNMKNIPLFRHIIWYKPNCPYKARGNSYKKNMFPRMIFQQYNIEHILVFFVPDLQKEHISVKGNINNIDNRINIKTALKWSSSLWQIPYESTKEHPAIFPEEIPFRLIKLFSFSGEKVLDPFMGRGTTLKIGAALNRDVIGYELNKNNIGYFKNIYINTPIQLQNFNYSQVVSKDYFLNSSLVNNSDNDELEITVDLKQFENLYSIE